MNTDTIEYIYNFYKFQKTQLDKIDKIKNWFIEIKKSNKNNIIIITGNTGIGKCLDFSTKILLNSGFYTNLYNVNIGDYILDPSNIPRKVLKICRGVVYGYFKITHIAINYSYKITPNHYLYLYNTLKKKIELISAINFYLNTRKSIFKGINIRNQLFDIKIEFIEDKLEYIGLNVENNLIVLENGIITHNSNIINSFLKEKPNFDVLEMGRLFEVYENNSNYTTKDFINKVIKQKNVNSFDKTLTKNKLLLIDSFEEYFNIHKNILRDLVDRIELINMPIIIVSTTNYYNDIEKKIKTKLLKVSINIDLESPSNKTIENYLKNILKLEISNDDIVKVIQYCNGDIRNLNNMLEFQKIGMDLFFKNTNLYSNINQNYKDLDIEFNSTLKEIKKLSISDAFNKCATEHLIFGMLTYQNYIYNNVDFSISKMKDKKYITDQICFADKIEKVLFKTQQWCLLNTYIFFSTIYPWKLLEQPKKILPSNTLQKFMNTKKRNKKYNLLF